MRTGPLLFLDTETTGLEADTHEILEVAAILTSPDGKTVQDTFEAKLRPEHLDKASPQALEVNGYNEDDWAPEKCTPATQVIERLNRLSNRITLVGHNVGFDEAFVSALFRRFGVKPRWNYHKVDTVALAWPLLSLTPRPENLRLVTLTEFFKIEHTTAHRAMSDAQACRQVFLRLMAQYTQIIP